MPEFSIYLRPDGGWRRCRISPTPDRASFEALLRHVVDEGQIAGPAGAAPPAGAPVTADDEPNGLAVGALTPGELRAVLASAAWTPRGPLLLGEHAVALAEFCRGAAKWLVLRATPDQVAAMKAAKVPVVGPGEHRTRVDADRVDEGVARLRAKVPADLTTSGELRAALHQGLTGGSIAAADAKAGSVPTASAALQGWLRSWASAAPKTPPPVAGAALRQELEAAFRKLHPLAGARLATAQPAELATLMALAAWSLDQARATLGQDAPWMTLVLSLGRHGTTSVPFPIVSGLGDAPARVAPYDAVELAPVAAAPVKRDRLAAFRLNKALRDALIARIPSGLSEAAREAWMAQQVVPEVRTSQDTAHVFDPFPSPGVVAFTPYGEVWLLHDKQAWEDFDAAHKRRAATLSGATLTWEALGNTSQGAMWVPLLSKAQLQPRTASSSSTTQRRVAWVKTATDDFTKREGWVTTHSGAGTGGLSEDQINRYLADLQAPDSDAERVQGMWEGSVVPRAARPYLMDSRVRAMAFTAAFAGEKLDWITSDSLIRWAFKGTPDKVLLPAGTVVYKFNDFTSLFAPIGDFKKGLKILPDDDVGRHIASQDRVSPWWSPWDGYEYGGGWAERVALSKHIGAQVTEAAKRSQALAAMGSATTPAAKAAASVDLGPWGPLLEMARLTSVVKENWNSLRYIVAIELVQPAYAFFGGFGSLNRIDLEPEGVSGWPPATKDGLVRRTGEKAKLGWAKSKEPETGRTGELSVGSRRTVIRGMELPGGSTQLYIPGLRWFHEKYAPKGNFVIRSLDEPELAAYAVESTPLPSESSATFGSFRILDLHKPQGARP